MEAALYELLSEGSPDDEVAVILRLADPMRPPEGVRVVVQFGHIATCRLPRKKIPEVRAQVESMKRARHYTAAPDLERIEAQDEFEAEPDIEPRPTDQRRPDGELPTGEGVAVAHIDFGIDFAHPDFRHPDGRSRLLALWDQSCAIDPQRPNRYGYVRIYHTADIDRALAMPDPYAALGYNPALSDFGRGSHGTATTSISVGNGRSGGPIGIAPAAHIIFVHLSTATGEGQASLGDSVAFLEALDFIANVAGERPFVISASIGRQAGEHDGRTCTERAMDAFLLAAPGRAICQSTGNYFDRAAHAAGVLRPGQNRTLRFDIPAGAALPTEVDLWYPGVDRFGVILRGPEDTREVTAAPGQQVKVMADGREAGRLYHRICDPNNYDNEVTLFLDPAAPAGSWELMLTGDAVADGRFHAWIERTMAKAAHRCRFHPDDVDQTTTLGTICNGLRTLAVGAYDAHHAERPLARFSSCGPCRDGRWKPDCAAPGVDVLCARSRPRGAGTDAPMQTRVSGTSFACPHVAGATALMFAAAGRPLTIDETRRLLLAHADPFPADTDEIDRLRLGSGYLNILAAVEAARRAGQPAPTPDLTKVAPDVEAATTMRQAIGGSAMKETIVETVPAAELAADEAATQEVAVEAAGESEGRAPQSESFVESPSDQANASREAADEAEVMAADPNVRTVSESGSGIGSADVDSSENSPEVLSERSDFSHVQSSKAPSVSRPSSPQPEPDLPFQFQLPITGGPPAIALPIGGAASPFALTLPFGPTAPTMSPTTPTSADAPTGEPSTELPTAAAVAADSVLDVAPYGADAIQEAMNTSDADQVIEVQAQETAMSSSDQAPAVTAVADEAGLTDIGPVDAAIGPVELANAAGASQHLNPGATVLAAAEALGRAGDAPVRSSSVVLRSLTESLSALGEADTEWDDPSALFGGYGPPPTATALFNALIASDRPIRWQVPQRGGRVVELVILALPNGPGSDVEPVPGDVMLRVARGEGWGHVAIVASAGLHRREGLAAARLRGEGFPLLLPGCYVHVVEPWPRRRATADRFARRLTNAAGLVLPDTLLLRLVPKGGETAEADLGSAPPPGSGEPATLRKGASGPAVRRAQRALNRIHADLVALGLPGLPGCPLPEDGRFDDRTEGAVVALQQQVFDDPSKWDGTIGKDTWAQLDLLASPPAPQPTTRAGPSGQAPGPLHRGALEWEDAGCAGEQGSLDIEGVWLDSEIWTGADDQIAFRDRVLDAHIAISRHARGLPQRDLRDDELSYVPGTRMKTLPDTAAAAGRLLADANAELVQAQQSGDADALRTIRLTVISGYRGSAHQRTLWIRYFTTENGYYERTQAVRDKLPEGPHSDQAVAYMLRPKKDGGFGLMGRIAAPGYSNHQGGIAIDFLQERQKGHEIHNDSDDAPRARWRSTWFHAWLRAHAAAHGFQPIPTEEWHWEYRGGSTTVALGRGAAMPVSGSVPASEQSDYLGGKLSTFTAKTEATPVAVFCPKAALSQGEVDVLVFAHGLLSGCPRPKRIPAGFITDAPFHLGRTVDASGRSVALVVPFLDWSNPGGERAFGRGHRRWHQLAKPDHLNALVEEVLNELGRMRAGAPPSLRRLIIAGHSRAYDFLEPLAYSRTDPSIRQGGLAKLSQVWALDTPYGGNVGNWLDWLNRDRRLTVAIFYRPGSKTAAVGEVFYGHRSERLQVTQAGEEHCDVPATRLPALLRSLASEQNPSAIGADEELEPSTAVSAAESPSTSPLEERRSEFGQDQWGEASPTPVLHLEKATISGLGDINLTVGSSGQYEGFFATPIHLRPDQTSDAQTETFQIDLTGRIQIEELGIRRNYDRKKDGKDFPLRGVTGFARVQTANADGPTSSTAHIVKVGADGTVVFTTSFGAAGFTRSLTILAKVELKLGIAARAVLELVDLDGFLAMVDRLERARPSAQSHLEFLASVRKIYQGGPNDELCGAFDQVLYRYRDVQPLAVMDAVARPYCSATPLFPPHTAEAKRFKLYKDRLFADREWVDISHVLTGIEGSPKQDPSNQNDPDLSKRQQLPMPPPRRELIVTWVGDLGSALQHYIHDFWHSIDTAAPIDLNDYLLRKAGRDDLIGDIDGINIGNSYDSSRPLVDNLRAYYGKGSRRRYHEFIANSKDKSGNADLPLIPRRKRPRLSMQARQAIAANVSSQFLIPLQLWGKLYQGTDQYKRKLVDEIIQVNSPEMGMVVEYFVRFLEDGLAREP